MGSDAQQDTTRCATGPQRGSRHVWDAGACVRCGARERGVLLPDTALAPDAIAAIARIELQMHQVQASIDAASRRREAVDSELAAMRTLADLDAATRERVLTWALARWGSR